jgi:AAA domain
MIAAAVRDDLDGRLARTAHLGKETRGMGAGPVFIKASELLKKVLPEHRWAVRGVLAEGLGLLVGRPKIGKSWLALNLAVAISSGGRALGQIPVEAGDVLYLALEDNERRLKSRLMAILGDEPCPDRLTLSTSWPKLDQNGLQWLEAWAEKHPQGRLIIIDTLQRVRPAASRNGSLYADDYSALSGLQGMAGRRGLTILVLHHTRKATADDPLETISGTQGLGGAADSVLVLKRDRTHRDATLFVTGRDVEETELTLRWDAMRAAWSLLGDALSEEREAVIKVLAHATHPLTVKDIALGLGRPNIESVKMLCYRMLGAGQISQPSRGVYTTTPGYLVTMDIPVTVVTPVTAVT